jgi:hypothetical protein
MLKPSRLLPALAATALLALPAGASATPSQYVPGEVVVRYAKDADRGARAAV